MKNITQSLRFMAANLVTEKMPDELVKEVSEALILNRKADKTEEEQAVVTEKLEVIKGKCPEKLVKQTERLGAKYPTDIVDVHLALGDFLFDLYQLAAPRPESPLGKRSAAKKLQDLSEILDQPEFEVPAWAKEPIARALGTDSIWSTLNVAVYVMNGDNKVYFTISVRGANLYNEILNAATAAFEAEAS